MHCDVTISVEKTCVKRIHIIWRSLTYREHIIWPYIYKSLTVDLNVHLSLKNLYKPVLIIEFSWYNFMSNDWSVGWSWFWALVSPRFRYCSSWHCFYRRIYVFLYSEHYQTLKNSYIFRTLEYLNTFLFSGTNIFYKPDVWVFMETNRYRNFSSQ